MLHVVIVALNIAGVNTESVISAVGATTLGLASLFFALVIRDFFPRDD